MKKKLKKGFTLVEMLVVVAIIGILSTILYSSYKRYIDSTKITVAQSEVLTIVQCFEAAMISNAQVGYKDEGINFESFTNFDELFTLDLVAAYNYISDISLPTYIELGQDNNGYLQYINHSDGIEIIYDTDERCFRASYIY